jgi:hypothetical protein
MTNKDKITHGNLIIIHIDDVEPSMAIIPKIDFQQCKISDIFNKIEKLHTQFPTCNFKHTSLVFEDKYHLYSDRHKNMSLTNWFHHHHILKDTNNNYIFYVEESRKKKHHNTKKHLKKSKPKKRNNKSKKNKIYSENV